MGEQGRPGTDSENLISNAIRYGGDGKYLKVSSFGRKCMSYIDISDKGKGIDKAFSTPDFRPSLHPGGFPESGNTG